MIYAGTKITGNADKLNKIPIDYLFNSIKNPKPEIAARIRQLRIVRNIDRKKYSILKKELPYFVCGYFNPPFRRTENFAYIEYFVVDIDHITEKNMSVEDLRRRLEKDPNILMVFLSPGEDGLKVLFRLKERCYDHGLYSVFYKSFIGSFSKKYTIDQVVDAKTSDVCRACFISCDTEVFYNPDATLININDYLDITNPESLFDLKKQVQKEEKENTEKIKEEKLKTDVDAAAIYKIKEILKMKPKVEKVPPYVPEQLNEIIEQLKAYIEESGLIVTGIYNISYGKKIVVKLGLRTGEINLFYGKKGYSVVESPRSGTNSELNRITADLINCFLVQ
jgi:hypothetical protein